MAMEILLRTFAQVQNSTPTPQTLTLLQRPQDVAVQATTLKRRRVQAGVWLWYSKDKYFCKELV